MTKCVDGFKNIPKIEGKLCDTCVECKQVSVPHRQSREKTDRPLRRVHSDLFGPINPVAHNGVKYLLTFVDDYTHFVVCFVFVS